MSLVKISAGVCELSYQDGEREEEEGEADVNPEDVFAGVEVDQRRVFERRLVALKVALEVDRQDDADGQDGDQEQVADHVALESGIQQEIKVLLVFYHPGSTAPQ